jgi:hypothetical protein
MEGRELMVLALHFGAQKIVQNGVSFRGNRTAGLSDSSDVSDGSGFRSIPR